MSDSSLAPGMRDPSRRTITNSAIKDTIVFEKYGAETSGAYTLVTCTVASGGGNPLRKHSQAASFSSFGPFKCLGDYLILPTKQSLTSQTSRLPRIIRRIHDRQNRHSLLRRRHPGPHLRARRIRRDTRRHATSIFQQHGPGDRV